MRPEAGTLFATLARESFRDATRRRVVPVIAVVALFTLLAVDSCTSCGNVTTTNLQDVDVAGWGGMVLFAALSIWIMTLAGLLASDHLAEPMTDGSAALVLARPVRRREFALARLFGVLGIAFAAGGVVLATTGALLHLRNGLAFGPAVWAGAAAAAGTVIVAAVSMALSLFLTRIATALASLVFVAGVTFVNSLSLFGAQFEGVSFVLQHFAPPLCTAVVVALSPWLAPVTISVDPAIMLLKLAFWVVASIALLLAAFEREEIAA